MPLPTAPLRRARCAAVGVVTGALAVLAHTSADGHLPDAGLVFSLVALLTWACSGFARHELTPGRLLVLIGGGQLAMHLMMSLASSRHVHEPDPSRMVAAHVVATAATVVVLAVAERAVLAVARALASVLPRRLASLPATAPLVVATPRLAPAQVVFLDVLSWRGPPAEQV
ncbi:hypothetical protein [Lentzea flava]|uniref:MFS transporter n=1 Tax=Lentzea flava TaxID=103732 RepID=A0ABQ2UFW6_9PSEU|nr:hypothetical protein [Lentzea flava]MCP2197944.1 hypothetical protein [Lentzea flava]GGU23558.1 hypothetical protein GCM10010178_14640 [Lentzea flava]